MNTAATSAPPMLPMPPRMTIASSREIRSYPVFGLKALVAPNTMPPAAVTATPIPKVSACAPGSRRSRSAGPRCWSCMVARTLRPNWVR